LQFLQFSTGSKHKQTIILLVMWKVGLHAMQSTK